MSKTIMPLKKKLERRGVSVTAEDLKQLRQNGTPIYPKIKYPVIETVLIPESDKVFSGTVTAEQFNELKNGDCRLKCTLDMSSLGRESYTLYCMDITQIVDSSGKVTLCGMTDTNHGTLGEFSIKADGEDFKIEAILRRIGGKEVELSADKIEGVNTAKSIRVDGTPWNMPDKEIICTPDKQAGMPTAKSIKIDGSAWNMPDYDEALEKKADKTSLTNGDVTQVGTSSVGGKAKPFYLNGGRPTECDYPIGEAGARDVDNSVIEESEALPTSGAVYSELYKKVDKKTEFDLANITLNGDKNQAPSFYAPTTLGSAGMVLGCDGERVVWQPISKVFRFMGIKDTLNEILDIPSPSVGDTWFCKEPQPEVGIEKGNWTYTAANGFEKEGWEYIGTNVDLEGYLPRKIGTESDRGKHLYVNGNGEIQIDNETVGSATKPVFIEAGEVKVSTGNAGSRTRIAYMSNGEFKDDGVEIFTGTGEPSPSQGKNGDLYIKYVE